MKVHIDIETRSKVDIIKAGAYRYALDKSFTILLIAYKIDDLPTKIIDLAQGEEIPQEFREIIEDNNIIKYAYNAAFEWWCFNCFGLKTDISSWRCTKALAAYKGYIGSLEKVGKAVGLGDDKQKLAIGKRLIAYFCVPCKATKTNGGREWNLPEHDIDKWNLFKDYCIRDVDAEHAIHALFREELPTMEQKQWELDCLINCYGVLVDKDLVNSAISIANAGRDTYTRELKIITGLANPNSNAQMLDWAKGIDSSITSLGAEVVKDLLNMEIPLNLRRALELRQKINKSSLKKYDALESAMCADNRVRGLISYYGARTGRWAGRLVQVHNLPRNYVNNIGGLRTFIKEHPNFSAMELFYNHPFDMLSQVIRTTLIAPEGKKLIVADYSAIEARVLAWLAGEDWVNQVFATHGKIYEAQASQMFNVPLEKIKKGNPEYALRQKGKVATLALGYQGGKGSLISMGALNMGIPEEDLQDIVTKWRTANKNIVALWKDLECAFMQPLKGAIFISKNLIEKGIKIKLLRDGVGTFLNVELPSGRSLCYRNPRIIQGTYGDAVAFETLGSTGNIVLEDTYGGKITENVVQAIARDCLAVALTKLHSAGYKILFHVHDEVIIEAAPETEVKEICDIMGEPIDWAKGLILRAEGFENNYYKKD